MNIYISGLSYGINDADLNELFSAYGETSSAKVSDTDGQKAINELNGAEYDQKTISVSVARPREERPRNNGYNSRRY